MKRGIRKDFGEVTLSGESAKRSASSWPAQPPATYLVPFIVETKTTFDGAVVFRKAEEI